MKKNITIAASFFLLTSLVSAQNKKSDIKFSSINSVGFLTGESQSVFTLQTINGIKYKTWSAGLGISLDNYGYRSVPVFMDIRKSFGNKDWKPFIYADAGINIPIYSDALPKKQFGLDAYKLNNTFYSETGIGFCRSVNKKTKFVISAGYSFKHFSYMQYNSYFILRTWNNIYTDYSSKYDFYYRRISLKMGLEF